MLKVFLNFLSFVFIILMNKIAEKRVSSPKRPNNLPTFLQSKQDICSQLCQNDEKKNVLTCNQYQKLLVTNLHIRKVFLQRANSWIKNTPKVIIGEDNNQFLEVFIQNPKKPMIENYVGHRRSVRIQKALEIITTMFKLSNVYGNYYCDKMMIRENAGGAPVIWIHERFKENEREFPIRQSSVAELLFIKKVKQTIECLLEFPKGMEIETKQKLLEYVQSEKKKLTKFNNFTEIQNSLKRVQKTSLKFYRQESTRSINLEDEKSQKSIKNLMKNKKQKMSTFYPLSTDKDVRSDRSKKYYQLFDKNKQRTKTTKIQIADRIFDAGSRKNKNSEKAAQDKILKNNVQSSSKNSKKKFKVMKFLSTNIVKQSERQTQKQETIQMQFDFQSQIIGNQNPEPKKSKQRKQSADVNIITSWIQKQLNKQISFPHSTFSTGISYSSINADIDNPVQPENEQKTQTKMQTKNQNFVMNHFYSTNKTKQTKQKMTEDIRKIMRQSGLKIAQQDSFQTEFQHIMNQQTNQQKKEKSQRSSAIIQEFQQLFDSFRKEQKLQCSFTKEFQNILEE